MKEEEIIPPDVSYQNGRVLLDKGDFKDAANQFDKVYFQHPGNEITSYAELMTAYSLYKSGEYMDAIDVIENFIDIHPAHEDIAYAYYLKGLCYYMQISDSERDQGITANAKVAFESVINRFPGTKYAIDSKMKIDLVNDHLAGNEMEIGRYYLSKRSPVAAINRFHNVVKQYQTTTQIEEALYRLFECYMMLGVVDEAEKYAAVLIHNYPHGKWSERIGDSLKKDG
jgi:outer membrane protein assembly factor BamD